MVESAITPRVLLFNLPRDERTARIEAYLLSRNIAVRHVRQIEFRQQLGHLLHLPDYYDSGCYFGPAFSDEMAVMAGFDAQQLNAFLDFFREARLKRIAYKAMLTPTNVSWDAFTLHSHLQAERASLEAARKKKS